jgi:hypothetical protein
MALGMPLGPELGTALGIAFRTGARRPTGAQSWDWKQT